MEKIAILGTGLTGIVTGVCLSDNNNSVICFDSNEDIIHNLKNGQSFINEPELDILLKKNILNGKVKFSNDFEKTIKSSWCIFLCEPYYTDDITIEEYVINVCENLANILLNDNQREILLVNTIIDYFGISDDIQKVFNNKGLTNVIISTNPIFIKRGNAIQDFTNPEKIIVGSDYDVEWVKREFLELYSPFIYKEKDIIFTDGRTAEFSKLTADSYNTTKINFLNNLIEQCETMNIDVNIIKQTIGIDTENKEHLSHYSFNKVDSSSCFMSDCNVNISFNNSYKKITFEELWQQYSDEDIQKTENFELINLEHKDVEVLGFDFLNFVFENQKVYYLTRRKYNQSVIYYETKDNHKQKLTSDHPIIYSSNNTPTLCLAKNLQVGYMIYTFDDKIIPHRFNLDEITKIEKIETSEIYVYSIETQNETVVTENGIISHNCVPEKKAFKKS